MNEKHFMPERYYSIDNNMSLDKILKAKEDGSFLTGKLLLWDSVNQEFVVDMGNDFFGKIPLEEFSIYPTLSEDGWIKASAYSLLGKNICFKVTECKCINEHTVSIHLSRKSNMLDALQHIKESQNELIDVCITSVCNIGIFVDAGYGVSGFVHKTRLTISRLKDFHLVGFDVEDIIKADVICVNSKNQVELDYRNQFDNLSEKLNYGDFVVATILEPVNDLMDGYFAYLNPNTACIVNVKDNLHLEYGTKVIARVRYPNSNHPEMVRLSFISEA